MSLFAPTLTDEQQAISDRIDAFLEDPYPVRPWFAYDGPAGTGKTVLLANVARRRESAVACAFTGKAASVLSRKMGMVATTIHSAIYQFMGKDRETGDLKFAAAHEAGDWRGQIALVDETSTVDEKLARDLLDTGCRVIGCGDSGQLPPVKGRAFFNTADASLKTVHRQAWDSPIIRQAHAVRAGRDYQADGDDFRVQAYVGADDILAADIILCWRNVTRCNLNRMVRAHKGFDGGYAPAQKGEPVMCLKNNHGAGVLNGAVYTLLEDHIPYSKYVCIENERGEQIELRGAWIEDLEHPTGSEESSMPFAMAYAATVHKFQGSEADNVILVDEYNRNEEREKWLYTGFTRAAKRMVVQRNW